VARVAELEVVRRRCTITSITCKQSLMNLISGILRIICGLAVLILTYSVYSRNSENIATGARVQILGYATDATSGQLTVALVVFGLLGLFLLGLGTVSLLRSRR
jgi:multisubunit Na+/H+ antiporter MnhB subunit